MKKISLLVFTIVFAAAFGVAYAGEVSNGITNFTGKSIDSLSDLYPSGADPTTGVVEGSSAGGLRSVDLGIEDMHNGVTDFTGRSIDTLGDLGSTAPSVRFHSLVKSAPRVPDAIDFGKPVTN